MNENKITWLDDILNENKFNNRLKKEISYLEENKNNISVFLQILEKHKNINFIVLKKFNLDHILNIILIFIEKNKEILDIEKNNNLFINYFLELIFYFKKQPSVWTLYDFNNNLFESNKNIEFNNILDESNFYRKIENEINNFIDLVIEDLNEGLYENWSNILNWEIIENENLIAEILLLENKIDSYVLDFSNIFGILFKSKEENIAVILNDYNYFDKQEELYNFVINNWYLIKKHVDWKVIHDFIIWISGNSFDKSFVEHIVDSNISNIKLHSLVIRFWEICRNL